MWENYSVPLFFPLKVLPTVQETSASHIFLTAYTHPGFIQPHLPTSSYLRSSSHAFFSKTRLPRSCNSDVVFILALLWVVSWDILRWHLTYGVWTSSLLPVWRVMVFLERCPFSLLTTSISISLALPPVLPLFPLSQALQRRHTFLTHSPVNLLWGPALRQDSARRDLGSLALVTCYWWFSRCRGVAALLSSSPPLL